MSLSILIKCLQNPKKMGTRQKEEQEMLFSFTCVFAPPQTDTHIPHRCGTGLLDFCDSLLLHHSLVVVWPKKESSLVANSGAPQLRSSVSQGLMQIREVLCVEGIIGGSNDCVCLPHFHSCIVHCYSENYYAAVSSKQKTNL